MFVGFVGRVKWNGRIKLFKDILVVELWIECRVWGLCNEGYKKDF